ncbi:hypothetical protein OC835_004890 [Tilletia horrida]|nr:hypothetical protein OC835_004890 [Tilletia horrida]
MTSTKTWSWFDDNDPLSVVDLSLAEPTDAQILDFSHLVSKATQRPLTQPSLSQPLHGLPVSPRAAPTPPSPCARPSTPVATASPSTAHVPSSSPLSSPPGPTPVQSGRGHNPPLSPFHGDAHNGSDDEDPLEAPTSAQPLRRRPSTASSSLPPPVKQHPRSPRPHIASAASASHPYLPSSPQQPQSVDACSTGSLSSDASSLLAGARERGLTAAATSDLAHRSASSVALNLDPSPFTGSQLCLNLIEPELRSAYCLAYQVAKKHVKAGTLPDWDVVWIQNCMVSYDPQVRALIRQYFDAVIQAYPSRHANLSSSAPATSASQALATQSAQISRASVGSSSSRPAVAPTRSLTGSTASRQLPLNDIISSVNRGSDALLTLSTAPRKAVANGEWRGFSFEGVVRWHKHAVEEAAITYAQWLAEHGSAVKKERSKRGSGSSAAKHVKAKTTPDPKPSRAVQYGAYRERWRCCKCQSQLHETVGRTGNLTKHRAKCL